MVFMITELSQINFKIDVCDSLGLDRLDEMLFILFEYHANTERMGDTE